MYPATNDRLRAARAATASDALPSRAAHAIADSTAPSQTRSREIVKHPIGGSPGAVIGSMAPEQQERARGAGGPRRRTRLTGDHEESRPGRERTAGNEDRARDRAVPGWLAFEPQQAPHRRSGERSNSVGFHDPDPHAARPEPQSSFLKEPRLKTYDAKDIRNVLLVGHGGSGKTTLLEAMLFASGAIARMGTVEDGNTVSDHDPDEQHRQISVSLSMSPIEWNDVKINVLDAPGTADFVGDVRSAVRAADAVIVVVSAVDGVEVQTEFAWGARGPGEPSSSGLREQAGS